MSQYSPLGDLRESHVIDFEPHCEYYVIGDVHGCKDEFTELFLQCRVDATRNGKYPRIIQLGDMIDRGPYFKEVILSNNYASYSVIGNHEYNFIMEHLGYKECRSKARAANHDLMKSLPADEQNGIMFDLTQRKSYLTMEAYGRLFVFSHAPIRGIEEGIHNVWRQGIGSIPDYCMRSTEVDMEQLQQNITRPVTFFHGHQSWGYRPIEKQISEQAEDMVRLFNVDSGCVYGGTLVAVRLRDSNVISVKSKVCVDK